jgi:hypothetical protein
MEDAAGLDSGFVSGGDTEGGGIAGWVGEDLLGWGGEG